MSDVLAQDIADIAEDLLTRDNDLYGALLDVTEPNGATLGMMQLRVRDLHNYSARLAQLVALLPRPTDSV